MQLHVYDLKNSPTVMSSTQAYILRRGSDWEAAALLNLESIVRINNATPAGMNIDYHATKKAATDWIAEEFQLIAKAHDSQAEWLPESGIVLTYDVREMVSDFPYQKWLAIAINELIKDWVCGYFWPTYQPQTP